MIAPITNSDPSSTQPIQYAILIKDQMTPSLSKLFDGFTVTQTASGETLLTGPVVDQSALHGLLAKIRDLNLTLISVNQIEPKEQQP